MTCAKKALLVVMLTSMLGLWGCTQSSAPSSGSAASRQAGDTDYGNILADCAAMNLGVFAIRVFAAGALLGQSPSAHTLKTPYFPLDLFQRDAAHAARIQAQVSGQISMTELAVRFALSHTAMSSAIIGFGSASHIREIVRVPFDQPFPEHFQNLWE